MSSITPERLAALVDESPTPDEAAALAASAGLRAELAALRRLRSFAAAERERVAPPLTTWAGLSEALARGGHAPLTADDEVRDVAPTLVPGVASPDRPAPRRAIFAWSRAAAAVLLLAGGAALGRISAGASALPLGRGGPAAPLLAAVGPTFASRDEAAAALEHAERTYRLASVFLAEHDAPAEGPAMVDAEPVRTRLAALEQIVRTSRAALEAAPTDPVINRYYLSTVGAREVTLQQLGGVRTASLRVAY